MTSSQNEKGQACLGTTRPNNDATLVPGPCPYLSYAGKPESRQSRCRRPGNQTQSWPTHSSVGLATTVQTCANPGPATLRPATGKIRFPDG
eukprot:12997241-Alexandrium_andersonii.AAC.1